MGWVRISDDFYDHPAFVGIDLECWGLWMWSLAWANRNLTDGALPRAVVRRMDPDGAATCALIESGRWVEADSGDFQIHGYLEFQPSAEQVKKKREKDRERWQRRTAGDSTATPCGVQAESTATPPSSQPQPPEEHVPAAPAAGYSTDFEDWYSGYPRKREPGNARKAYQARRRAGVTREDLLAARDHYASAMAGVELDKVKYPASFLNGKDGPWSEWVTGPPEPVGILACSAASRTSQFPEPARAVLGRGADAPPTWVLDDDGNAVKPPSGRSPVEPEREIA